MSNVNINILKFEVDQFVTSTSIYVGGENYNSLVFINYGTSVVNIDAVVLQPNQQFEIGGNTGEITTQRFFVNFGTSTTGNNCVIVRKRYTNI